VLAESVEAIKAVTNPLDLRGAFFPVAGGRQVRL
jgi:hypothetical protein